jgi:hypothetical protein
MADVDRASVLAPGPEGVKEQCAVGVRRNALHRTKAYLTEAMRIVVNACQLRLLYAIDPQCHPAIMAVRGGRCVPGQPELVRCIGNGYPGGIRPGPGIVLDGYTELVGSGSVAELNAPHRQRGAAGEDSLRVLGWHADGVRIEFDHPGP